MLNTGDSLGRYVLLAELGSGGMATVYQARHAESGHEVAIKVLRADLTDDDLVRRRFRREGEMIHQLRHPHLVPMHEVNLDHQPPYLVMALIDGSTLHNLIASAIRFSPAETLYILNAVASALDYAHGQGVIHRDVKPANILIERDGSTYLSDLGLARLIAGDREMITLGGAVTGTPEYMSPEQATGSELDHRADLYALGVILFELLTGRRPYTAATAAKIISRHILSPVPSAADVNPALPAAIDTVFQRALAKDAAQRYETAAALIADAANVLSVLPALDIERLRGSFTGQGIRSDS